MKQDKTEDCSLNTNKGMRSCNTQNIVHVNYTPDTVQYVEKFNWATLWY
jgi:hypothetical protein